VTSRNLAILALLLSVAACKRDADYESYKHPASFFVVDRPAQFTVVDPPYPESPSAMFLAPPPDGERRGQAAALWVQFYAKDDPVFKNAEEFLASKAGARAGRVTAPIADKMVEGRKMRIFTLERDTVRSPEDREDGKVRETQAIYEDGNGFYLLGSTLPLEPRWKAQEGPLSKHFDHLLATFKPAKVKN
jgi:hypothetical protein